MGPVLDPKTVAETNRAVDIQKLEELDRIRCLLASAGLLKKANYRLGPPLGKRTVKAVSKQKKVARQNHAADAIEKAKQQGP